MTTATVPAVQAYCDLLRRLDDDELAKELEFIRRLLQSAYEETYGRTKAAGAHRMQQMLNTEMEGRQLCR